MGFLVCDESGDNSRVDRPRLLYAHRGAAVEFPENTLAAFRRAVEIGVDAIETDVHMTRDGHVVISHDPGAERMANVRASWRDVELAEARRFDLGWGHLAADGSRPHAGRGICVATLEEAIGEFPGMRWNVDLKQAAPSMVGPVLSLIRRLRAEDRVTLASFRWRTLLAVRRLGYGGDTALSQPEVAALLVTPDAIWRRMPFTGTAAQIPVSAGPVRLDRAAFIARCHRLGMRVDFWTINRPDDAARLLALGADGIMTDDPAAIAPVFRTLRVSPPPRDSLRPA
jgi:glycerophosphoryl diester phosphodiesterase